MSSRVALQGLTPCTIILADASYKGSPMKTVSLKLPESLDAKLSAAARQRQQTKSALVREILEEFLDNGQRAPSGSCLELVADLVGCVEGPGDLSYNKRHLRGFGE